MDAETIHEVVDETVELAENIQSATMLREHKIIVAGVAVGALTLGFGAGYFLAKRSLASEFEERFVEDVESVRDSYQLLANHLEKEYEKKTKQLSMDEMGKAEQDEPPKTEQDESTVELTVEKTTESISVEVDDTDEEDTTIVKNKRPRRPLSEQKAPVVEEFDYETEAANRSSDRPYIITADEFHEEDESSYEKSEMTYFVRDDVVIDSTNLPVSNIDDLIGYNHLDRFGYGSGDPQLVYIRNESLELDFEITKNAGSYASDFLGIDDDYDDEPKVMKFRGNA